MKKIFIILMALLSLALGTFGQPKNLQEKIIALEKAGWNAWKDKDTSWFQKNTTAECLWVSADGITNKAEMIKSTLSDCNVRSVSLDDFKFIKLNNNTVLLTYVATQDGVCGGTKLSNKIRASVNYINRQGKWLEAFYMETPIVK